jgi:flagellar basal body P-ring formation protein FlgA
MRSSASLVVLGALLAAGPAAAERIAVSPDSVVSGASVRLGDVATLEGERVRGLAELVLASAPAPGESRSIAGTRVLDAVKRELPDLQDVRYTIPPLVRVRRASQDVPADVLRELVERFLDEQLASNDREPKLRSLDVVGPVRLPPGPFDARVMVPPNGALVGRIRLQIELTQADQPTRAVWATADVGLEGPVVLVRRAIERGEALRAEDVTVERREISDKAAGLLVDPSEAEGRVARVPLAASIPLRRDMLAAPPVVRRGDAVLLVAQRGSMRLTVPAEVKDDAGLGESVKVTNRVSRKDVVGRVLDARTVAVDF